MSGAATVASPNGTLEGVAVRRHRVLRQFSGNTIVVAVAGLWVVLVVLAAVAPELLTHVNPDSLHPTRVLHAPSSAALLGTEQYGRSVYTLLVYGAHTALLIGVAATAFAVVAGGVIGLLAGYLGGWVDTLIGRLLDIMMSLPGVLLALVITASAGASVGILILSVGVALVAVFARIMRGTVMSVRSRLYVEAARSIGYGQWRILLRHVLPNSFAPIVVLATISVGDAIVLAASLSYLGLGPKLDVPDWGQLLASGQAYLQQSWWITTFSGFAIALTVVSISLLGDWLRDRIE